MSEIKVQLTDGGIKVEATQEAFAQIMGYSGLTELIESHGSFEAAVEYWKGRWNQMGVSCT